MVACFRYASIDVHSVFVPPAKLDFNYGIQDWIQKEADEVQTSAISGTLKYVAFYLLSNIVLYFSCAGG